MVMKLTADKTRCIGAAACVGTSVSVLELDENGKVTVLGDGIVPDSELAEAQDAVAFCPVTALRLERRMVLDCPCGQRLVGFGEDDMVAVARQHLEEAHPHLDYSRDEILALAR